MKNKSLFTVKVDSEITLRIRTKDEAFELFSLVKKIKNTFVNFCIG